MVIIKAFNVDVRLSFLKFSLVVRTEFLNMKGSTIESHKLQFSKLNDG